MALAGYMHSATNVIAKLRETLSNNLPGLPIVVPLEIPDVFKDDEGRFVLLEDIDDLMKQGTAGAVSPAFLRARLGERLTWKSCAENVMLGNAALRLSNIPMHDASGYAEVL